MNTPARVRDTLAKLAMCRTHVMGGRKFQCEDCHETTSLYNSCGDRHCVRVQRIEASGLQPESFPADHQ